MKSDTEKRLEQYGVWVKVKPREVGKPKAQETSFELSDLEIPESEPATESSVAQPESGSSEPSPLDEEFDQEPSAPSGESVRPLTAEEERLIGSYTPEESDASLTQEEEKLLDDLETELAPTGTPETAELEMEEGSPPIFEESAQGLEVPEIALGQESGEELPELELDEESSESGTGFPEEESEAAVEVPLSDEVPQDEHFDDLKALEDELSAVKAGASSVPQGSTSSDVLARIEEELKSIKTDLTDLRRTLTELRQAPPQTEEPSAAEDENKGFFDEDEDETIALTGDELDNILNTAEITEGTAEPEAILSDEPDTLMEKPDILEYVEETPKKTAEAPGLPPDIDEPPAAPSETDLPPEVSLDESLFSPSMDLASEPVEELTLEEETPVEDLASEPVEELTLEEETPVEDLASEPVEELTLEEETPVEDLASEPVEELTIEEETPVEDLASDSIEDLTFEEETPVEDLASEPVEELTFEEETPVEDLASEPVEELTLEEENADEAAPMEELDIPQVDIEEAGEKAPEESGPNLLDIDLSMDEISVETPSSEATPDLELSLDESDLQKPASEPAAAPSDDLVIEEPILEMEEAEEAEETQGKASTSEGGLDDLELDIEDTENPAPGPAETEADIEMVPLEPLPVEADPESKAITIDDDLLQREIREIDADAQMGEPQTEAVIPDGEPLVTEELPEAIAEPESEEPAASVGAESPTGRAPIPDDLKDEVRSVLKYLDQLLEALPEDKIKEFADSEYFTMYKKLFEELGLGG